MQGCCNGSSAGSAVREQADATHGNGVRASKQPTARNALQILLRHRSWPYLESLPLPTRWSQ
jgi:hypothetical protein